ncbi:hypothetical protein FO519_000560 [Halicephalobus sp. NKZ332]|nr:hypothetical protein FO519_000560 [Halicephalobus sp. NKZ332]
MDGGEAPIRQGFLCPFCFRDLCEPRLLENHVFEVHPENKEAVEVFKGAVERVKERLLNIDLSLNQPGSSGMHDDIRREEIQTMGFHRCRKDFFINEREKHVTSVVLDTNGLIMRLDKLLNDCPPDVARKASDFEKSTVPWVANSSPSCFLCAAKFSMTRRRHHCRLCGSIVCKDCSMFLPYDLAERLINPASSGTVQYFFKEDNGSRQYSLTDSDSLQAMKSKTGKLFSAFGFTPKDDGAEPESSKKEPSIRVCLKCKTLLERRRQAMDQMQLPFVFRDMYEKLRQLLQDASNVAPAYKRNVESLRRGESLYTLEGALKLRKRLATLQQEIQSLISRIEKWGLDDDPLAQKPTSREFVLRANIRLASFLTIEQSIVGLGDIPTPDEYRKLQVAHRERITRSDSCSTSSLSNENRINHGHSEAPKTVIKNSASFNGLNVDGGWTAQPVDGILNNQSSNGELDVLQEQYIRTKDFLRQAAESGRLDEAETLERMSAISLSQKLVLTDEGMESYRKGMIIIGIITAVMNALGIAYILKCPFSVIGSYKWHLLNIAVCSCLMDLHFSLIFIGFPLFPILGFCSVGFLSGLGRFLAEDVQYLIFIQLFGLYGLSLVNAILYHMTKIVGAKSFLRSKKAIVVAVTMQFVYPMPCWIYHIFLIPTEPQIKDYVRAVTSNNTAMYIESHACSLVVGNTGTYVYLGFCILMVFLCSITVFSCCGLAVLLLLRNKSGKTSKEYKMFKSMTIGLISQLVFPMLVVLIPMIVVYIQLANNVNPADYTPLAFQVISLHSTVNIVAMVIFTSPLRQGIGIFPQETDVGNELFERRYPTPSRPQTTTAVVAFSEQL